MPNNKRASYWLRYGTVPNAGAMWLIASRAHRAVAAWWLWMWTLAQNSCQWQLLPVGCIRQSSFPSARPFSSAILRHLSTEARSPSSTHATLARRAEANLSTGASLGTHEEGWRLTTLRPTSNERDTFAEGNINVKTASQRRRRGHSVHHNNRSVKNSTTTWPNRISKPTVEWWSEPFYDWLSAWPCSPWLVHFLHRLSWAPPHDPG